MTVSPSEGGTVAIDGVTPPSFPYTAIYAPGTDVHLEASPAAGNTFNGWTGSETSSDNPFTVAMTCDKTITANFGEQVTTGTISGKAWEDQVTDSIQGEGEAGMQGIPVHLYDGENHIIATVLTDENGAYAFSDLAEGQYRVRFIPPETHVFSPKDNSSHVDYAGLSDEINITAGQSANINAGITLPVNPYPCSLDSGWELFSIPYYNGECLRSCEEMLEPITDSLYRVYAYMHEGEGSPWWSTFAFSDFRGTLPCLRDGEGFWFLMNGPDTLDIGSNMLPPSPAELPYYDLQPGWDLFGFKSPVPIPAGAYLASIAGQYSSVMGWADNNYFPVSDDDLLQPGKAYWVYMLETGRLYPYLQIGDDITTGGANSMIMNNQGNPQFVILDVRTPGEYANGYISGSINFDYYSPDFQNNLQTLDKRKVYLVHCASGIRSRLALDLMIELGFREGYNMLGGFNAWKTAGLPYTIP